MGRKTVYVSDFSGAVLDSADELVRIVVLEHPDLVAGPVRLEARPDEVESIDDAALDVAVVEIHDGQGDGEPRRVVLTASEFDSLATDVPMAQLLRTAERVKPAKASRKAAERVDYATLEHAGKPHRGKTTDDEARLVRDHLDEINKRLADEGLRQIDPADPDHAERYGFARTADPD
ncbi:MULTISPECIES: hypothetical protein [unclassified Solwaraspora]|uniref:hypothetical protein n=1 Tax=unclassified Solwaraspora TaxID=2627926 RepID=UPI00248C9E33|nr:MULTISPECIES: hypothetical protein [unclassified Solwaraspora]WBB95564.1 hypothetical protein O7553_19535 [Solwaraspora sp. WMMA2059]WBC20531.1 hypothetical protein O7543_27830 [Solwaraspora sp. WMMA2080]WJK37335.1 hypothetical protein O7610_13840 [Solwaraspora sp. WMMA2065]